MNSSKNESKRIFTRLADHGIDVNLSQHHVEKPTRIYVKNFMDMESIRFAYLIGTAVLEIRKMNF